MLDNLDPREHRTSPATPKSREIPAARPVADREVPIERHEIPAAVQAWLDGDLPESAARHADANGDVVDFWLRVDREVQVRRELKTPTHLYQQIMDALPQDAPETEASLWSRPITMSPAVALATAAGAFAVGVALGAAVVRTR
jgi:hypothetical protein